MDAQLAMAEYPDVVAQVTGSTSAAATTCTVVPLSERFVSVPPPPGGRIEGADGGCCVVEDPVPDAEGRVEVRLADGCRCVVEGVDAAGARVELAVEDAAPPAPDGYVAAGPDPARREQLARRVDLVLGRLAADPSVEPDVAEALRRWSVPARGSESR